MTATLLLQLRVLGLGFLQDGDAGVGVFLEREEIFVGGERPDAGGIGVRSLPLPLKSSRSQGGPVGLLQLSSFTRAVRGGASGLYSGDRNGASRARDSEWRVSVRCRRRNRLFPSTGRPGRGLPRVQRPRPRRRSDPNLPTST